MPEPPASSLPAQFTVKVVEGSVAGTLTLLVGAPASRVLVATFVLIGALVSKTIVAWASIRVPEGRPALARTEKLTKPSPSGAVLSGGRNPTDGSLGRSSVSGS